MFSLKTYYLLSCGFWEELEHQPWNPSNGSRLKFNQKMVGYLHNHQATYPQACKTYLKISIEACTMKNPEPCKSIDAKPPSLLHPL